MTTLASCKSCGAEIIWIKTPTGKNAPIDAKPEKRWAEINRFSASEPRRWALLDTYLPHFASCPNADQHRRER